MKEKNGADKSGVIVLTLIEKLKRNEKFFGEVTAEEGFGKKYSYADITLKHGESTEEYLVVVMKKIPKRRSSSV